jgi:hypothetical protein
MAASRRMSSASTTVVGLGSGIGSGMWVRLFDSVRKRSDFNFGFRDEVLVAPIPHHPRDNSTTPRPQNAVGKPERVGTKRATVAGPPDSRGRSDRMMDTRTDRAVTCFSPTPSG